MSRVLIALGGNALVRTGEQGTFDEQAANAVRMVKHLLPVLRKNHCLVTHGNAPQAGSLLLQQEAGKGLAPPLPLYACVAMTQAEIGFLLQSALARVGIKAATIVTQTQVSPKDPAFRKPTKPIGPYYAQKKKDTVFFKGRGWRRVVASPRPLKIVEEQQIKKLFDAGSVVVAGGGGGIPAARRGRRLTGVDAVIDKDATAVLLARAVKASLLLILMEEPCVYENYETNGRKRLKRLSMREAEERLRRGEFAEGSMKPKIQAAVDFLRQAGRKVIITSAECVEKALRGEAGTVIVP